MDIIEVLDGGMFTTVQDLGRYGYQRYGVPVSGAMDTFALRAANLLVGNREGDAGLEMTLAGPNLRFLDETVVAITGADLMPALDGEPVPTWQPVAVQKGAELQFHGIRDGVRAYLAIAGGVDIPPMLGSRSTYTRANIGGLEGRPLAHGDRLAASNRMDSVEGRRFPRAAVPHYGHAHWIRVTPGQQEDAFTEQGIETFLSSSYTVTPRSDRIGYRLEGSPIEHKAGADIVSDGISFGAVQVTGDGMPIVLLADRGTTGGYTKIAIVISADIMRLAQAAPGDVVTFHRATLEEAHEALLEQENLIQDIRKSPSVVFARHRLSIRVNDREYIAETGLSEAMETTAEARTVRASLHDETYTFTVEVDGNSSA